LFLSSSLSLSLSYYFFFSDSTSHYSIFNIFFFSLQIHNNNGT